jgi:hypothetical protein
MANDAARSIIGMAGVFFVALFCYIVCLIFKFIARKIRESSSQNNSQYNRLSAQNNRSISIETPGYAVYDAIIKCPYCGQEYPIQNDQINKKSFCKNCDKFFIIRLEGTQ